jgi:hypothetical protein
LILNKERFWINNVLVVVSYAGLGWAVGTKEFIEAVFFEDGEDRGLFRWGEILDWGRYEMSGRVWYDDVVN